jgi:hypothetical protein
MEQTGIAVTSLMLESLRGTRRWVKFVSVLLMVSAAFTVFGGLMINMIEGPGQTLSGGMRVIASALYTLVGIVYAVLAMYLWGYGRAITRLDDELAQEHIEDALDQQRKFWRLVGLMAALFVSIAVLSIVAAIAIPALAGR